MLLVSYASDIRRIRNLRSIAQSLLQRCASDNVLNLKDTKTIFQSFSFLSLVRGLVVSRICRWKWTQDNIVDIVDFPGKWSSKIVDFFIYHTVFKQFCAGKSVYDVGNHVIKLRFHTILPIFNYAVESDISPDFDISDPLKLIEMNNLIEDSCGRNQVLFLQTMQAIKHVSPGSLMSVRISAICNPYALKYLSDCLKSIEFVFNYLHDEYQSDMKSSSSSSKKTIARQWLLDRLMRSKIDSGKEDKERVDEEDANALIEEKLEDDLKELDDQETDFDHRKYIYRMLRHKTPPQRDKYDRMKSPIIYWLLHLKLESISLFHWTDFVTYDLMKHLVELLPELSSELTVSDSSQYQDGVNECLDRLWMIGDWAFRRGIRVIIEEEKQYFSYAIDYFTRLMQLDYNLNSQVVIMNSYSTDRFDRFMLDYERSAACKYSFGVQLNHETSSGIDILTKMMIQANSVVILKSHSRQVIQVGINIQNQYPTKELCFCQVLGASDHLSFSLASSGYRAMKLISYGQLNEAIPSLLRFMALCNDEEYNIVMQEVKRRFGIEGSDDDLKMIK